MIVPTPAERFIPGFTGVPGERTFYFQITRGDDTTWYLVEKAQVAAFAVESTRLLAGGGFTGIGGDLELPELGEPSEIEFRVGEMRIVHHEEVGLIAVELIAAEEGPDPVTVWLTPGQLDAAARTGAAAVRRGRPRCPHCGLAMDPEGHACPTSNGDLRGHRP